VIPPSTQGERATPYAWYIAAMLGLAYLISIMDRYLLTVVIEDVKQHLDLTDTQLGILQGPSFTVFFLLASIPCGRLADVASRRMLVFAGLFFWSLATAACGFASNFTELMIGRLAVGMGEATLLPSAMSLLPAFFPRTVLSRGISIYSMGGSFGRTVGFTGGGLLLAWAAAQGGLTFFGQRFLPWQTVFLAGGAAGIAVALWFLLTVREPPRLGAAAQKSDLRAGFQFFGANWRAYLAIFLPFSMTAAITALLASWAVSFLFRRHQMTPANASQLIGVIGLAFGPVGHLFGGWLIDNLRKRGVVGPQPLVHAAQLLVSLLLAWIFVSVDNLSVAMFAYGVSYFVLCSAGPTGYSGVQLATPAHQRGFIASLFLITFTALGTGLGPALPGFIGDWFFDESRIGLAMLVSAALAAAIGICFAVFGWQKFTRAVEANERLLTPH
jgi:MFS family permease